MISSRRTTVGVRRMLLSKLCNSSRYYSLSSPHHKNPNFLSIPNLIKSGLTPNLRNFNQFLQFLSQKHKFQTVIHFFVQLKFSQVNISSYTRSIYATALIKQNMYEQAAEFMKIQIPYNIRLWNSLILGMCNNQKDPEKALSLLKDCLRIEGNLPSSSTLCSLIYRFGDLGRMDRAIDVLELMTDNKIIYACDNFVASKVISGFVKIGKPNLALEFFDNAKECNGLSPNIVTYTALLSAFCRLGRFEEANELISTIEKNGLKCDIIFYSCWIYEHFREGILGKIFQKYREIFEKKIELDTISYTILIDGFSKEGYIEKGVGLLKSMQKGGFKPNLITYTATMLGFCKKGKLDEAFSVLKVVEKLGFELDEFTYATLIEGVCKNEDFDRVFDLIDQMERKGISPSVVTYNMLLNGLCKAKRTNEADEISKGIIGNAITFSTLLQGYIEEENSSGILEIKRRIEESGVCMDVVMCNILLKALFMVGSFEDVFTIYKGMQEKDLIANSVTYCTMIDGFCKSNRIDKALEAFDDFQRTFIPSIACYNCILCGLCKSSLLNLAIEVFLEVNERGLTLDKEMHMMLLETIFKDKEVAGILDFLCRIKILVPEIFEVICNDAIYFLCKNGFSEAACDVYCLLMRKNGIVMTIGLYYSILKGLIRNGKRWPTQPILNSLVKNYGIFGRQVIEIIYHYLCIKNVDIALKFLGKTSVHLPINILESLNNNGRVLDAFKLVKGANSNLSRMDVVDFSIIIDGLCKNGYINKALSLCNIAKKNAIKLNIVTYNSILHGLCCQGCLFQAFRLFDSLEKINLVPSEITYGTLIDALSNEGHLFDARKLFDKMIFNGLMPNTRIYNSLVNGYCRLGQIREGLTLFLDLEANSKSIKPDEFTVSALINGFCKNGDINGALKFFYESKEKKILPDLLGFLFLIKGLCSKGEMEEARTILKEMLETESVVNLLNKIETGLETESVQSFLVFLCEQGRIKEAITVLSKIGSMFFPVRTKNITGEVEENFENDSDFKLSNDDETEEVKNDDNDSEDEEIVELNSFDSYYKVIASSCSRGDMLKANKLAKMIRSL